MSIREEWRKLVADGWLYDLPPADGDPWGRTVLMTKEVNDLVDGDWEENVEGVRRARLLATLQNFVAGRRLVVCLRPFEARVANIGRLDPVDESIFDVRCQEKPALRVFGRFVEKNVFLASTCRPRTIAVSWLDWLPLGDRHSKEWESGKFFTRRDWARFFPAQNPVSGDDLHAYLTNADLEGSGLGT
jgi:hypothetical protein